MTTSRAKISSSSLRAFLLACTTALAAPQHQCHAFSSHPPPLTDPSHVGPQSLRQQLSFKASDASTTKPKIDLFGKAADDKEDRSRPNIVVIKTHEDYVKFLEEDDRLCAIKFYANWCKSCQKFGVKYRQLAFDEGDHIDVHGATVHSGEVRFAEAEYSASAKLCKSLKVAKLPTVHMYRRGEGKIADMTCKPSLFHLVVDAMHRLMGDSEVQEIQLEKTAISLESNSNVTSTSFDGLANEIMTSLRGKGEKIGTKEEKGPWFPFTF
eukprot:CAMPEP_0172553886 /NCGR_PEP_ID=MMETSP1067-20121228/52232_1 /TAXON_ID=265564 ORGANISM="Thalassiosira punctigera, Strain Tpunct2005C2" /NCGR_SAMPLE_ID=MMETSP1067 /ASSEMBLY_ACC=CAM_ASM_000444 /LENGTH=266 /DNA_ID=CAMNT_0013342149 /DNA_START=165 /DNA_END=965 /DNA_ORIENTATION=+